LTQMLSQVSIALTAQPSHASLHEIGQAGPWNLKLFPLARLIPGGIRQQIKTAGAGANIPQHSFLLPRHGVQALG